MQPVKLDLKQPKQRQDQNKTVIHVALDYTVSEMLLCVLQRPVQLDTLRKPWQQTIPMLPVCNVKQVSSAMERKLSVSQSNVQVARMQKLEPSIPSTRVCPVLQVTRLLGMLLSVNRVNMDTTRMQGSVVVDQRNVTLDGKQCMQLPMLRIALVVTLVSRPVAAVGCVRQRIVSLVRMPLKPVRMNLPSVCCVLPVPTVLATSCANQLNVTKDMALWKELLISPTTVRNVEWANTVQERTILVRRRLVL